MKKSFLALAVAALAATSIASTASATTVYDKDGTSLSVFGRVQTVFYSDKQSGVSNDEASINASARLGVDLRTQITSGIAAFARAEWDGADGNNVEDGKSDDHFKTRYLWVGLDFGQAGSLKVGKFEPAIKYAISQTDIFDDFGCAGLAGNDDKREGVVQYQWSGYGFDAIASYVFAKDNEHIDGAYEIGETADMKNTVSLAVGYTSPDVVFGPIAVRAGYEFGNFADGSYINDLGQTVYQNSFGNGLAYDDYKHFAVGVSWGSLDLGPYVGAVYHQRAFSSTKTPVAAASTQTYDLTVTGYEFAVGYSFANGVTVRTGYMSQNYEEDVAGGVDVDAAVVPVYANWQINPQFNVWAEARFDAGTDDNETNSNKNFDNVIGTNYGENVYSAGMRYVF